ncbi:hypothetical protein Cgig2_011865 [Carnegiea gigantea]|uniref:DUF4283 domain-containing protein n=1 Tax=Carnegiea gigantea TaxID=171969 RepID=A0A9Q1K8L2_9CARY|nr:hypothetical protein Cgig2_011865 [Carnegiea gigantea]
MASGLEEAWQKLKKTDEEEKVVVADDEDDVEKNKPISLCLLGSTRWAYLLLKQTIAMEILSNVEFQMTRFWVEAYNVPWKKQTVFYAKLLASNIEELVSCDKAMMMEVDKVLCFREDIDTSRPLRRGINMMVAGNSFQIYEAPRCLLWLRKVEARLERLWHCYSRRWGSKSAIWVVVKGISFEIT